ASPEAIFLVAMNSEPPIWDDVTIDDRGRLSAERDAAKGGDVAAWWRVIYRAKRLLQLNSDDADARAALQELNPQRLMMRAHDGTLEAAPFFSNLSGGGLRDLVLEAELIQRNNSEIVVLEQDHGDRMFVVLDGQVGVITSSQQ